MTWLPMTNQNLPQMGAMDPGKLIETTTVADEKLKAAASDDSPPDRGTPTKSSIGHELRSLSVQLSVAFQDPFIWRKGTITRLKL